jgi:hypothetical protein
MNKHEEETTETCIEEWKNLKNESNVEVKNNYNNQFT